MKKNRILFFACCLALGGSTTDLYAQRTMDKLGRGLVATVTQSGSGNFVSWRVLGEEYYDVTYNLYADGVLVAKGLSASTYQAHRQFHKGSVSHNRSCLKVDVCLCSSRLFSAIRLTAASRSPPDSSASRCTSSFSDSSVENVKYSSSLTSVAYTAEWVPPSPIHTSR